MGGTLCSNCLSTSLASSWLKPSAASGDVRVYPGGGESAVTLRAGQPLPSGSVIRTGSDGRATIVSGKSTARIGPASRTEIPIEGAARKTTLIQSLGSLFLKVEKRAGPDFEVKTPYLAAVVKGTTFTVNVTNQAASVSLMEGSVEVTDLGSLTRRLLRPGETALVAPSRKEGITILGGSGLDAPADDGSRGDDGDSGASKSPSGPSEERLGTDGLASEQASEQESLQAEQAAVAMAPSQGEGGGAANQVVLTETLGEVSIDIFTLTGGLVRDAGHRLNVGAETTAEPASASARALAERTDGGAMETNFLTPAAGRADAAAGPGQHGIANGINAAKGLSVADLVRGGPTPGAAGDTTRGNGNAFGPGGNPNSNAGGNGNAFGHDNGNAFGHDNGNNGNGNGNAGGNPNSNAGGNGNAFGHDNGNNGNGNGNAGGNPNGNAGGNPNGNAGGNPNGNAGGKKG